MQDYSKLRCPICKGTLTSGATLACPRCSKTYPIVNGIPVMLTGVQAPDGEQDIANEKEFYEQMFGGVTGVEDGHCIVYGHDKIYDFVSQVERGTVLEAGCGGGHHGVADRSRDAQRPGVHHRLRFDRLPQVGERPGFRNAAGG